MNVSETVRLIVLILKQGKLRNSGFDFDQRRQRLLATLPVDIARSYTKTPGRKTLPKIRWLRTLISEAAYIRRSFPIRGGHLKLTDREVYYIRIPKAASTAICKSILLENFPSLKDGSPDPEQLNALADVCLQHTIASTPSAQVFTVVRNPFARIVAVYRAFFERPQDHFIYNDYLFGIIRRDHSFREFVRAVQLIPDELKDQHLKPQHRFLVYYQRRDIPVNVIKLEHVGEVQKFLASVGLSLDETNRSDTPYDYHEYYDAETLERVGAIYREDLARFDYGPEWLKLKFAIEQRSVRI